MKKRQLRSESMWMAWEPMVGFIPSVFGPTREACDNAIVAQLLRPAGRERRGLRPVHVVLVPYQEKKTAKKARCTAT